jgi:hypothetical protein
MTGLNWVDVGIMVVATIVAVLALWAIDNMED